MRLGVLCFGIGFLLNLTFLSRHFDVDRRACETSDWSWHFGDVFSNWLAFEGIKLNVCYSNPLRLSYIVHWPLFLTPIANIWKWRRRSIRRISQSGTRQFKLLPSGLGTKHEYYGCGQGFSMESLCFSHLLPRDLTTAFIVFVVTIWRWISKAPTRSPRWCSIILISYLKIPKLCTDRSIDWVAYKAYFSLKWCFQLMQKRVMYLTAPAVVNFPFFLRSTPEPQTYSWITY